MAYDGAALVYLLSTKQVATFEEYASSVFLPHIRVDLVGTGTSVIASKQPREKSRAKV